MEKEVTKNRNDKVVRFLIATAGICLFLFSLGYLLGKNRVAMDFGHIENSESMLFIAMGSSLTVIAFTIENKIARYVLLICSILIISFSIIAH
jgi:hypothetical protein